MRTVVVVGFILVSIAVAMCQQKASIPKVSPQYGQLKQDIRPVALKLGKELGHSDDEILAAFNTNPAQTVRGYTDDYVTFKEAAIKAAIDLISQYGEANQTLKGENESLKTENEALKKRNAQLYTAIQAIGNVPVPTPPPVVICDTVSISPGTSTTVCH